MPVESLTWEDLLRALGLLAVAYGAWVNYKRRPPPFKYQGKVYYALPDGRFCSRWGRIVKDEALHGALREAYQAWPRPPQPAGRKPS